jgi:hypothetical protein
MKKNWSTKIKLNASGVAVMQNNPGSYRLMYMNPKTKRCRTFFIGEAQNMRKELAQHLPWREKNREMAYYLNNYKCFFQVCEQLQSEVIEITPSKPFFSRVFKMFTASQPANISYR